MAPLFPTQKAWPHCSPLNGLLNHYFSSAHIPERELFRYAIAPFEISEIENRRVKSHGIVLSH